MWCIWNQSWICSSDLIILACGCQSIAVLIDDTLFSLMIITFMLNIESWLSISIVELIWNGEMNIIAGLTVVGIFYIVVN